MWHPVTIRTIQELWSIVGVKDQAVGGCLLQEMSCAQNIDLFHIFSGLPFLSHLEVWTKHPMLVFLESISVHFLSWVKSVGA